MNTTLSALAMIAALALTTACGESAERPTEQEVAASLKDESSMFGAMVPKESADCFAEVLHTSEISDGALDAIVRGDTGYRGSKKDEKAITSLTDELVGTCAPR